MAFTIKLYTFKKHENSTAQPTGGTEFSCNIKSPSSLVTPIAEFSSASNPIAYNYAYISEFSRYYFIDDWTFDRGLWIASLRCDVLATYKTEIGGTNLYILRSSATYNTYVKDNYYPMTGDEEEDYDSDGAMISTLTPFTDGVYVLNIIGTNTGSSTLYEFTPTQFVTFLRNLFTAIDGFTPADVIQSVKNLIFDPMKYINGCMWFPAGFTGAQTSSNVKVGMWDSGVKAKLISEPTKLMEDRQFTITKHPQSATRGQYLNMAPYTQYNLYFQPFGLISLDASALMDSTNDIHTYVYVDALTGEAELYVIGSYNTTILASVKAQYGVPLNLKEDRFNLGNAVSTAMQVGSMLISQDPSNLETALIGGASAGIGSIAGAISGVVTNLGASGGILNFTRPRVLYSRFFRIVDEDNTNNGRPLCEVHTPSSLTGFMQVMKGEIEINGTQDEANQIRRWLEGGFYYE